MLGGWKFYGYLYFWKKNDNNLGDANHINIHYLWFLKQIP
jgi:hypothetical protein